MNRILVYSTVFFFVALFNSKAQTKVDSLDFYLEKKELIKALNYAKKKSEQFLTQKKYKEFCKISVRKAKLYGRLNDHDKSLTTLYNAITVAEKYNINCKSEIIEQIGTRYSVLNDTIRAFKNYYKAKKIALIEKDTATLIHVYHNLFRLHTEKNLDSSYYYLQKKFKLDKLTNSVSGLSFTYNNFFAYYSLRNDFEMAKKYMDTAYTTALKYKDKKSLNAVLSNYGYYYMVYENNFKKGAEMYLRILEEFKGDLTTTELKEIYLNLVYAYEQLGDYKRANYYSTLALEATQKINSENLSDKINEIETKYAIDKVESEYKEKAKLLDDRQSRNKKIIFIFIALFGFSLILFYFYFQNLQLKQRNKIKEIDSEIQENIINASIDGQELERKKLAEVLHDNISALLSSAGLHLSAFLVGQKDNIPEEIIKARSLLKDAHDKVRDLSHELIPPVLAKLGLYLAIQDLCEKNTNSIIQFTLHHKGSNLKRYHEDFELKVFYIVTELFNNILKHSDATNGEIFVEEKNNQMLIKIMDNGKGFDTSKSFQNDGFGLTQIKARVKNLKGKIYIQSELNVGTTIKINLPIVNR